MGCLGVGKAARGEHLITNQGQELLGIRSTSKKSWFSKLVKSGVDKCKKRWGNGEQGVRLTQSCVHVHPIYVPLYVICEYIILCLG